MVAQPVLSLRAFFIFFFFFFLRLFFHYYTGIFIFFVNSFSKFICEEIFRVSRIKIRGK